MLSLIDRVILLSHPEFQENNFKFIINVLRDNGYPLNLIFSTIRKRLHARFSHHKPLIFSQTNNPHKTRTSYFTIPYISSITKKFIQYFKNCIFVCKLAFTCYNKLNKFIKVHKDSLPITFRSNVVCKINCLNCDASYVGQTKRTLIKRIDEHRNHIRRDSTQPSVITNHRLECSHDFDWDGVEVLDEELNLNKRLVSEMIHIKKQKQGLNLKKDTELLHPIYNDLFL